MNPKPLRVVCLFGTGIIFDKTLSVLLEKNVNVVGVVNANKHQNGVDFSYLKIAGKKHGYGRVFLQILGRIYYKIFNSQKDRQIFNQIYRESEIQNILKKHTYLTHQTDDYGKPETMAFIQNLQPDLILVHSGYWVGKKVRNIVNGRVIGGHPGITPDYRGVHSPFWAIFNGEPEKLGYSVFWLDSGVDTGDILYQSSVPIENGDSYFTLSWKGMVGIAENQARLIKEMESGLEPKSRKVGEVDDSTNYTHPTIFQYWKYRKIQKEVR